MGDEVKDAWSQVADGFARLGQAMRDGYIGQAGAPETSSPPAGDADSGLRDALERFVAAGRDIGQRAAGMARDVDVNNQAKQVAASLNDALSATVDMIGREIAGLFERQEPATGQGHVAPAPETTAGEVEAPAEPPSTDGEARANGGPPT